MVNGPASNDQSLAAIGEFGLIKRIASIVGATSAVRGIGDDAAVLDIPGDAYLLATVDMLVEDVHFRMSELDPESIGRCAIAVNASDIASMGGSPTHAIISLGLSPALPVAFVDGLYVGMIAEARECGASIVGGNIARTAGPAVIDVILLGTVPKERLVTRSGAREGDVIAVTGSLGDAAAARMIRSLAIRTPMDFLAVWLREHRVPIARVREASTLAHAELVHAMMDLSDGLASDIRHLCESSAVGAVIDEASLPVSKGTTWAAKQLGIPAVELALSGGEDYELLVAMSEDAMRQADGLSVRLTPVGRVVARGEGVKIRHVDGSLEELRPSGWTHF